MPKINNTPNYTVDSSASKRQQAHQDAKPFAKKQKTTADVRKPKNETSVLSQPHYGKTPKVDPKTGEPSNSKNAISVFAYLRPAKVDSMTVDPRTGEKSNAENSITIVEFLRPQFTALSAYQQVTPNVTLSLSVDDIKDKSLEASVKTTHSSETIAARAWEIENLTPLPLDQAGEINISAEDADFLSRLLS
jgi:hypothetical protein